MEIFQAATQPRARWHQWQDSRPPEGPEAPPDASAAAGPLDVPLYLPVSVTAILHTMAKIFQTIPRAAH